MINIETLLSSFDDRGTLMRWLNAVEKALNNATLSSVEVVPISAQTIKLKFNFADGTSITTPEITLPKGDKGDKGDTGATGETGATGVSVTNVTVNANNHLLVTLSNGTTIDAGEINVTSGVVIDTTLSTTSENPVQNRVITLALNAKASQADLTALLARVGDVEGEIGTIEAQLTNKANASDVYTKTESNTLLAGKQATLNTTNVPTGTIVDKIGFDGNGELKRATDSGGGSLHEHFIDLQYTGHDIGAMRFSIVIFSNSNVQFTLSTFLQYLENSGPHTTYPTSISSYHEVPLFVHGNYLYAIVINNGNLAITFDERFDDEHITNFSDTVR